MSRLHSGETAKAPSLLNLFIRHQHGHRHMAFSITISTHCLHTLPTFLPIHSASLPTHSAYISTYTLCISTYTLCLHFYLYTLHLYLHTLPTFLPTYSAYISTYTLCISTYTLCLHLYLYTLHLYLPLPASASLLPRCASSWVPSPQCLQFQITVYVQLHNEHCSHA